MKVHLELAKAGHVKTFARQCEPEEHEVAALLGWPDTEAMFVDLVCRSSQAYALTTPSSVVAMGGLLSKGLTLGPTQMWLHMPPAFKQAGFGALRVVRLLVERWLGQHDELVIDVEASKPELVRMADWLGFKHRGFVEKFGRVFHQAYVRRKAAA